MYGRFLSADIFQMNSSASSPRSPCGPARIRADPPVSVRTPPDVNVNVNVISRTALIRNRVSRKVLHVSKITWGVLCGTFAGRSAESAGKYFWRTSGGVRAYPHGFARIRGRSSSAEPIAANWPFSSRESFGK